jgi:glycosyltransferase involved in cell wall biosynthesis
LRFTRCVGALSQAVQVGIDPVEKSDEPHIKLKLRSPMPSPCRMNFTLSVVIPCFNEVQTIEQVIDAVKASPVHSIEIIIVDDCSTDGTRSVLEQCESRVDRVIYHSYNQGKGAALRTGFAAATGDVVIVQDADLEYDPQDFSRMIEPILQNKADVVFGSRFMGSAPHRVVYYWHMLGNQFLTTLSNMLTNINLSDMETCYKAFRREIIQSIVIEENRFGFEPEITAKVSKLDCRIYEVGIAYYGRTYREGKKIGWKDGVSAIVCILKYNLLRSRRNILQPQPIDRKPLASSARR